LKKNVESQPINPSNSDEENNLLIEVEKFISGAEEAMKISEMGPENELILKEKQKAREILFREIIADSNYDNLLSFILKKVLFSLSTKTFHSAKKYFLYLVRLKILQIMKSCKYSLLIS